ncbi:MAG: type II toxin-antitoxin system RelE/ParE family toxin [Candidatus Thermoplasmatota archaeon]
MSYQILISTTFQKQLERLDDQLKKRVKDSLEELEEGPYEPRSGADIKKLSGTDPTKYRLRIGDYRVIYTVDESDKAVKVIEGLKRGKGYRKY